jgi:translation initiation factor IF-2
VQVRLYTVIYDVMDDMRKAMEGLLEPTLREVRLGQAEVRDTFKISKVGTIAGSFVTDGKVNRNANVRLLRDFHHRAGQRNAIVIAGGTRSPRSPSPVSWSSDSSPSSCISPARGR